MQHRLLTDSEKKLIKKFIDDFRSKDVSEHFLMREVFVYASGVIGDEPIPYTTVFDFIYFEVTGWDLH